MRLHCKNRSECLRFRGRILLILLLSFIGTIGLTVATGTFKPFRDEKLALFLWGAGVVGFSLISFVARTGRFPTAWRYGSLLIPVAGIGTWRLFQSLTTGPGMGAFEPGLPAETDHLLRALAVGLAGFIYWLAASTGRLTERRAHLSAVFLVILAGIESAGVALEVLGEMVGWTVHPFLGAAAVAEGQTGLKTHFFGSLGNSNFLAGYLVLLFPSVLCFATMARSGKIRRTGIVLAAVMACEVVLCRSKGALIGLLISGVVLLFDWKVVHRPRRYSDYFQSPLTRWTVGPLVVAGAVVGIALLPKVGGHYYRESYSEQWVRLLHLRGESLSQRILLAYTGIEMWKESPWTGIGPGRYRRQFLPVVSELLEGEGKEVFRSRVERLKSFRPVHVHNDFLEILVEWGVIGYASFMAFLSAIIVVSYRTLQASAGVTRRFRLGCLAGFTGGLGYSLFEFPLHLPPHLILMAAFSGWGLAEPVSVNLSKKSRQKPFVFFGNVVLFVLGIGMIGYGNSLYVASSLGGEARELLGEMNTSKEDVIAKIRKARDLDPGNPEWDLQFANLIWKLDKNPSRAIEILRRGRPLSDDPTFLLLESQIALETGRVSDALHSIAPLRSVAPYLPGVGYIEGRLEEMRGNLEAAREAYARDLRALGNFPEIRRRELHPDLHRLYLRYGDVLERLGRFEEAANQYLKLVGLETNRPLALVRLGKIYRDHFKDYPTARKYFEQALDLAKENALQAEVGLLYQELSKLRRMERDDRTRTPGSSNS